MSRYNTLNHEKYRIQYHIIFSTKYRKKCLEPVKDDLLESMKRAESLQNKWNIETMETDKDHIHFLINASPVCMPADIIHSLKQVSTYDMWEKNGDYMKKYYWSRKHYLWTRGYFISTIGDVSEKTVKNYIERQG
ncbi:MAG: IS200/IS605 family transposase [Clostridia bacterium]|jgi:putative transposase|nr:IS200/IS605 family transposase [Clostridia bacterium]